MNYTVCFPKTLENENAGYSTASFRPIALYPASAAECDRFGRDLWIYQYDGIFSISCSLYLDRGSWVSTSDGDTYTFDDFRWLAVILENMKTDKILENLE